MNFILYIIFVLFLLIFTILMFHKSRIAGGMSLIQLVSVGLGPLVDDKLVYDNVTSIFIILFFCWMIFMIIKPWERISAYNGIVIYNDLGRWLRVYSKIFIFMGIVCTLAYIPVVVFVYSLDIDINEFKYNDGMYELFTSGALPIPHSLLSLATLFSRISILLVPLHFYYLCQKKYKLALLTLFASSCYLLDGMTYFSRSVPIHYFLLYLTVFYVIHKGLDKTVLRWYKRIIVLVVIYFGFQFIQTSVARFDESNEMETMSEQGDANLFKYIDDPTIVSYVDYLSQGHYNAYDLVSKYNFDTFGGKLSFSTFNTLLSAFGIELYSTDQFKKTKETLWPGKYNYSFNSFLGYIIYDFGVFLSVIFCFIYYRKVRRKVDKLRNKQISFVDFTLLTLLIQIPLNAIFYSMLSFILMPIIIIWTIRLVSRIRLYKRSKIMTYVNVK